MITQPNTLRDSLLTMYEEIASQHCKLVSFTSCSANEGTTTIACAMAKAIVSLGKKVLYCDFSHYDTSLSKMYNKSLETLQNDVNKILENIVFVDALGFFVLPAPVKEQDLINIETLEKVLEHCKNEYDVIFLDTMYFNNHFNSNISTTDICKIADTTIIVVLSGSITEEDVKKVTDKMKSKGIKILGFVMNDVNHPRLIDELHEATHQLDDYFPNISEKLRAWLQKSSFFNMDI